MDASPPSVSVVIPAYNSETTIGPLLESLSHLDYPHYEVIVVDDGSKDRTGAIADGYPFRVIHQPNQGASAARDAGLRATRTEIVAYVDSDVTVTEDWLGHLVQPFQDKTVGATTGRTVFLRNDRCTSWLRSLDIERRNSHRNEYTRLANGPNCAFRRDLLVHVGGFDPSWYHAEDTEASYRIWDAGYRIKYVPEAIVRHVPEDDWRNYLRKRYRDARAYSRMLRRYPSTALLRDDFVSLGMKIQPPLYAALLLALVAIPFAILLGIFPLVLAILVIGYAVGLLFAVAEALPVLRGSGRWRLFPAAIALTLVKGHMWAMGLITGNLTAIRGRLKSSRESRDLPS